MPPPLPVGGPDTFAEFIALLCKAGTWFFTFAMAVGIIMIIYAAFNFMASGGSPQKIETGKKVLMFAIVGIFVALLPIAILKIVASFVGTSGTVVPC